MPRSRSRADYVQEEGEDADESDVSALRAAFSPPTSYMGNSTGVREALGQNDRMPLMRESRVICPPSRQCENRSNCFAFVLSAFPQSHVFRLSQHYLPQAGVSSRQSAPYGATDMSSTAMVELR